MEKETELLKALSQYRCVGGDFFMFHKMQSETLVHFSDRIDDVFWGVCTKGDCELYINTRYYQVKAMDFIAIAPGTIIKIKSIGENFEGSFLSVSKKLCDEIIFNNIPQVVQAFIFINENQMIKLENKDFIRYNSFYNFIWNYISDNESFFLKEEVQHLLTAMALWLLNQVPGAKEKSGKDRWEEITKNFMKDLTMNFTKKRRVSYYAQIQHIAPKYFSMMIKDRTGKTASEWINYLVILEAKSQLRNTKKNIQEISEYLSFPNQSFFGKYFKKNTGTSPSEYRKS